jgi:hypothetical protein
MIESWIYSYYPETKQQSSQVTFLSRVITGDESRIYSYDPETKQQSSQWRRPKRARQVKSEVKSMIIIFFDIMAIVQKKFFLAGQTVNSAYYCDILWWLQENMRTLCPELWRQKNWLLHHDNALCHTSFPPGNS